MEACRWGKSAARGCGERRFLETGPVNFSQDIRFCDSLGIAVIGSKQEILKINLVDKHFHTIYDYRNRRTPRDKYIMLRI